MKHSRASNFIESYYHEARARIRCYYSLYIIFSANPEKSSEELGGDQRVNSASTKRDHTEPNKTNQSYLHA